jgi:mono/diheme cytochrome c family protein
MYKGILHTHYLVVTLFLLIYVIKTVLLLSGRNEVLQAFTRKTRIFEIVVSVLFLATGIYLTVNLPFGGKFDYLFWIKLVMVTASIPLAIIGFKRANKILAALSLLLITGSFGIAEVYSKRKGIPKQVATADAGSMDARSLYMSNCGLCHGADGKLGAGGSKDLSKSALDLAGIKEIILKGRGLMVPVKVTEEQAGAIAEFVNSELKGR